MSEEDRRFGQPHYGHRAEQVMSDWRVTIIDVQGREIDALNITADSWPAALTRAAQFYVTSKAMTGLKPVLEVRVRLREKVA